MTLHNKKKKKCVYHFHQGLLNVVSTCERGGCDQRFDFSVTWVLMFYTRLQWLAILIV